MTLLAPQAFAQTGADQPVEVSVPDAPDQLRAGQVPVPQPPSEANLPEVEPIIPDEEFNQVVPALDLDDDPLLSEPLESIEEFERRIAQEETGIQRESIPPDAPLLVDEDFGEEIGDAPIRDAELMRPLPPIEQFEVQAVEFAEAADSDVEPVEVAYRVEINGLDEADEETDAGLRATFNDLSALRNAEGDAANVAMVAARLAEDVELMSTILASEGWFDPNISSRIDRPDADDSQVLTAVIDVIPGRRYEFAEIHVNAQPTVPSDLIDENFALRIGQPIIAERVLAAEAQLSVALPQAGYPFVEIGERDILLDRTTGEGVYTLPVDTGPRSRFGGFITDGDMAFGAEHIAVLARFEEGELYDSRLVDDLRQALVATGLFSTIAVEPQQTGEDVGDGTEYVRVSVDQDAGPPRTIAGSAGYGTGAGLRVEGSWTHRNMFPPEGALIVHGVAGTSEQGAGVTFRRSNAGRRDRTFELAAEALHSDYDAYDAYTGRLGAQVRYSSTPLWQKTFTYAYGLELLATAERDYDFETGERNRRTYYIAALNGQVGLDFTDDLLDPTEGFRLTALVQPEGSLEDGFNPYVRARIDGSAYYSVSDSVVLAGRVRLGTIQGADRVDIAPSRRLYAGGGGSVRGFGYQKLGPQDPNGDPMGGRSLNEAAAEVRYRFGNFGVVGFVDVGQSYIETLPQFSDLRFGAGIGARYYTNFGPLRIDLATPLDRRPGESRFNIYVSIGQAF